MRRGHVAYADAVPTVDHGYRVGVSEYLGSIPYLKAMGLQIGTAVHVDSRMGQITELRYFGGLSEQEVAEALSISRSTVTREWQTARTWLYRHMTKGPGRRARR